MFTQGFEKEAGLKHWLAAAAVAGSPHKAKANDMAGTVGKALQKTEIGQTVEKNVRDSVSKIRDVKLFGGGSTGAHKAATEAVAAAEKPSLSIKDGSKLELGYKKFKAYAKPGETGASYDFSKGGRVNVADTGREKKLSVSYSKEF